MSIGVGNDGLVTVGGDVIAEIIGYDYTETRKTIPYEPLGSKNTRHFPGSVETSGNIKAMYDPDDAEALKALRDKAVVDLKFFPFGDAVGKPFYQAAEAIITSKGMAVENNKLIEQPFGFIVSGPLIEGVVAA